MLIDTSPGCGGRATSLSGPGYVPFLSPQDSPPSIQREAGNRRPTQPPASPVRAEPPPDMCTVTRIPIQINPPPSLTSSIGTPPNPPVRSRCHTVADIVAALGILAVHDGLTVM